RSGRTRRPRRDSSGAGGPRLAWGRLLHARGHRARRCRAAEALSPRPSSRLVAIARLAISGGRGRHSGAGISSPRRHREARRRRVAFVLELCGGAGAHPVVGVAGGVWSPLRAPLPFRLAYDRAPGPDGARAEDAMRTVLGVLHFVSVVALNLYGLNAYLLLAIHWWNRRRIREAAAPEPPAEWPSVTVQLPLYNERYVARRLLEAVGALDYPHDRLEIQVLDDSTDDTGGIIAEAASQLRARGLTVVHLH